MFSQVMLIFGDIKSFLICLRIKLSFSEAYHLIIWALSLPEVWFLDPDSCPVLSRDEQVTRGEEGEEGGSKNWINI